MGGGCSTTKDVTVVELLGKRKYIIESGAVVQQLDERKHPVPGVLVVFTSLKNQFLCFSFRESKTGTLHCREFTDDELQREKDNNNISHGWAPFFKSIASDVTKSKASVSVDRGVVSIVVIVTSTKDPKSTQNFTVALKSKPNPSNKDVLHWIVEPMTRMVQAKRVGPGADMDRETRFMRWECELLVKDASQKKNSSTVDRLQPAMKSLRENADKESKQSSALSQKVQQLERRLRKLRRPKDRKHPIDALYEDGGARSFQHIAYADEHEPHEKPWSVELADVLAKELPGKEGNELGKHMDHLVKNVPNTEVQKVLAAFGGKSSVLTLFSRLDSWDYNVFEVDEITGGNALFFTTYALLHKLNLPATLGLDDTILRRFLCAVQAGYHPNPYHNSVHAADVAQINYFIMMRCALVTQCALGPEEILASVLAGAIHDYDHPGLNNNFHAATNAYLATLYNDRSILENHHLACVYEMLRLPKFNIFGKLTEDQNREIRDTMVEMVMSTDMGIHGKILSSFQRRIQEGAQWSQRKEDSRLALSMSLKMADIANCGRPNHLYTAWAKNIAAEFYNQGDVEQKLKMTISPFMDRRKDAVDFPKGQTSFINFIVIPTFEAMAEFLPLLQFSLNHCTENREYWKKREQ